jgi:transcriptional regulator with XRE-family HTH domain
MTNLREARKRAGLKQRELAEKAHVCSRSSVTLKEAQGKCGLKLARNCLNAGCPRIGRQYLASSLEYLVDGLYNIFWRQTVSL